MDLGLLGIALNSGKDALEHSRNAQRTAVQDFDAQMASRNKMMDLALRDSMLEDSQVKMGLDLIKALPVRNEQAIDKRINQANKQFEGLRPVMAPIGVDPEKFKAYAEEAMGSEAPVSLSVPSVGVGAKMIKDSYQSGKLPQNKQQSPQRSPQGYMDNPFASEPNWQFQLGQAPDGAHVQSEDPNVITASPLVLAGSGDQGVQPLEGGQPSSGGQSPYGGQPGIPAQEQADPRIANALDHVTSQIQASPYEALRNPHLRRAMFDAMARQGSIPNLAIQSEPTIKSLGELDQTQFLAAKQAATLNQQSAQAQAKLEMADNQHQIESLTKIRELAERKQDHQMARQLQAQIQLLQGSISVMNNQTRPKSAARGSEDKNKTDYRRQLNDFTKDIQRINAATIRQFGVLDPQSVRELVQTEPETWQPIMDNANRLYNLGKSKGWNDVLDNYEGFGNLIRSSGKAPGKNSGSATRSSAPPSGSPAKGQQKKLSSGRVVTFDGSQWK